MTTDHTTSQKLDNIPEELRQDPAWVCWRYEQRDGKWTKNLYQPNGWQAATDNPATWTAFEAVRETYERDRNFHGVGFVFHDGNPYAGADFDHMSEEQARRWLEEFDSYTERSPSGDGLHVICKAELPRGTKKRAGELYSSGRFFTMTGDVVRDAPVRQAQGAAERFYSFLRAGDAVVENNGHRNGASPTMTDADVVTRAQNAKNGERFAAVYAGEGNFASASEGDMSLARMLAFWTQGPEQIERIMRGSGCARPKWDKHRTYLRDTIEKAIEWCQETYTGGDGATLSPNGSEAVEPEKMQERETSGTPTHDELRDRWIAKHPHRAHGLGEWRRYDAGVWQPIAETSVKAEVSRVVEAAKPEGVKPTTAIISSVAEMARIKQFVPDERWDAEPDVLICENGALRISTGELTEHQPELYATSAVPYPYDPEAVPVMWRAFLKETVGEKTAEFLQEFAGYALTTDTSHEIAVWLQGPRGSGKSTTIAGFQAMLGHRAGVLGLADLERSRFTLANLPGKTLMVAREQPSSYLASTDVLDTIISGEPLQVERKYHDPYTVIPRAKLCWAMNELPRVANANAGIFRRVKVVAFPDLPADQLDPGVKRQIEAEGAGILNWALEGLRRLRARGYFEIPESVQEATTEFEESNDVSAAFLESECVHEHESRITGQRLYEAYSEWCKANGHKPLSSTRVPQEWKRLGLDRKRIKGTTYYQGARIKLSSEFAQ